MPLCFLHRERLVKLSKEVKPYSDGLDKVAADSRHHFQVPGIRKRDKREGFPIGPSGVLCASGPARKNKGGSTVREPETVKQRTRNGKLDSKKDPVPKRRGSGHRK